MDKMELVSSARQPTLGVRVSPLPIAHAPCVQGVRYPSTRAGGVKCDDPNELGESLEVDLAYQTCWIFWIARGDTCLEAVHMR